MYGIEDDTGNVDVWNYGELFGAIDVALFVLIIGGFLGVTMKTGAINAGIAWVVSKLKGKEKWMFPILMTIFAIGGTTYGMAEETLAFYALIITVMLAAGYDGLTAAALIMLGAGIGVLGSTINPFATGIASGFAGTTISEGLIGRLVILVIGTIIGILFVMRYGERVRQDPSKSLIYDAKADNEKQFMSGGEGADFGEFTGRHKVILVLFFLAFVVMVYGVIPWEDLGIGHPNLVVVVPGDDRLVPLLRHRDRRDRPAVGEDAGRHLHRRRQGHAGGGADHRRGPWHHGGHEQRPDHRHGVVLGGTGGRGPGGVGFIIVTYPALPAALLPDPLSSGLATVSMPIMAPLAAVRRRPSYLVVTAYQNGQRFGQPGHAHLRRGDGWPGHRPGGLRHLAALSCGPILLMVIHLVLPGGRHLRLSDR